MRYRRKKGINMGVPLTDDIMLKDFIKQNKEQIYALAKKNTKLNSNNQPTISKDDPWFNEDEWDQHFSKEKR
ncbi:MAG: hypothetical protein ACOX2X_00315 [Peptococcia bacterium]|mgnify:CR=1 FL=1|jgi:hypothetical protein